MDEDKYTGYNQHIYCDINANKYIYRDHNMDSNTNIDIHRDRDEDKHTIAYINDEFFWYSNADKYNSNNKHVYWNSDTDRNSNSYKFAS